MDEAENAVLCAGLPLDKLGGNGPRPMACRLEIDVSSEFRRLVQGHHDVEHVEGKFGVGGRPLLRSQGCC